MTTLELKHKCMREKPLQKVGRLFGKRMVMSGFVVEVIDLAAKIAVVQKNGWLGNKAMLNGCQCQLVAQEVCTGEDHS